MSFNFFQLIPLVFIIVMGFSIQRKNYKIAWTLVLLFVISLFFMPVKLTQNNIGVYESNSKFNDVPKRVVVPSESFKSYQDSNLKKLKKESNNETPK